VAAVARLVAEAISSEPDSNAGVVDGGGGYCSGGHGECGGNVAVVAMEVPVKKAMVPKTSEIMATSAAKVLEATTVVSMTATKRRGLLEALTSNGSWGDGPADAEAMVPKTAGNSSDSGGEVFKATTVVAADAMVRKMARAAPKVLQATVMVAENDGSEDFGNYGDSGCEAGEVTAVVGGSDDPGRDEGSDVALEAITAVDVVAIVAAEAMVRKTPAINGDSSSEGNYGSEDCGNYGGSECESSYGDRGGRGNGDNLWTQQGRRFNNKTVAITYNGGGEVSSGDGGGRGGIDNPGRGEGGDAD
ncbi:hypothetical protein Bbelb_393690, partial [Branchiostoma belcheri]